MKTKQIFKGVLLTLQLTILFICMFEAKSIFASNITKDSTKAYDWWKIPCSTYGCTGITCIWTSSTIYGKCPTNWQNNPDYGCICN